jgi:hypothetical protein
VGRFGDDGAREGGGGIIALIASRRSDLFVSLVPRVHVCAATSVDDLEILREWITQLGTVIGDVRSLLLSRHIFWEIQRIIEHNPKTQTDGLFNRWMATNYSVSTAIGVRRHLDTDGRSLSLMRLLCVIEETVLERPSVLSREGFIQNYRPELRLVAEQQFDLLAGKDSRCVEPGLIRRDIGRLSSVTEKIKYFANKRVAHWDHRKVPNAKLGELDECLDLLAELVDKYARLLTGSGSGVHIDVLPDWKQIFRVAWID